MRPAGDEPHRRRWFNAKNQVRRHVEGRFGVSVSPPGAVVKVTTAA